MDDVPATASEHPPTWKFAYPIYHPPTREAWRAWLSAHQDDARGVWVATWRRETNRPTVDYGALVEEALCVGWIDATVNVLDDDRNLQLVTPRRRGSPWSRINKERLARLERAGRIQPRGRAVVDAAIADGSWTRYDAVEELRVPPDLAEALDAVPAARAAWDAFPPSARKQMLWWVISAVRDDTRAGRVAAVVDRAAVGQRARG